MEKKWWTLLGVCGGTFMLLLDTTIVYVVMPDVQRDLDASFADLQWVIDGYALALAALLLTSGTLADRFGRKRLYAIGVGLFTLASLLCGVAQSPMMLILSRVLQGMGGSVMFATGLALLAGSFQGKERGTAFGVWGMVTGLASAIGPVAGGLISNGISWRGIFLINVPIGVVVALIIALRVDESRSPFARRLDWPGFILLTGGLATLIYGLIRAGETEWSNSGAVTGLALGSALLLAFLVVEARSEQPMFDLKLFRIPTFVGGSIAAFAMNGSLFAMFLFLAIYFQEALQYSSLETGLRLLTASLSMLAASLIAGRLSAKIQPRYLIGVGLLVVGAALLLMGGVTESTGWTHFIPGLVLGGIGAGLVNPPLASTAVGVVDFSRSGMASGVNGTFRQLGVSAGVAVLGSTFAVIIGDRFRDGLGSTPELAGRSDQFAALTRAGEIDQAVRLAPGQYQDKVEQLATAGFVDGLNTLLTVSASLALVGGVLSLLLIRPADFEAAQAPKAPAADARGQSPVAAES
ncbi:MFS transporter [Streptomyces sp. ALI-76-A]|jgi:EmrB/QacA subfamily drug resistance transporter|uniref:MFS transporter n=1 Tax=Streptomyces sp. ALI-76-A TaxID=3025736 RepID=UPI00256F0206|nr:MFS transporter [Streptomyces sp. ALI-76-A]MDL5206212.1 MFS transporter [Streptomyces sp. ALI-76-A]